MEKKEIVELFGKAKAWHEKEVYSSECQFYLNLKGGKQR